MRFPRCVLACALTAALAACGEREDATLDSPAAPVDERQRVAAPAPEPLAEAQTTPPVQPPLEPMTLYLAGLQVLKDDVGRQNEAHRYCAQMRVDFAQCVVFDGNGHEAHLTGVEYIISGQLYDSLPKEEKAYWHPRNYSVLSGQLVAPQVPLDAEKLLMQNQLNTYAKAWHLWDADSGTQAPQPLPMGPARLAWSFNREGEVQPGLLRRFGDEIDIDLVEKQRERTALAEQAQPQAGVDALRDRFKERPLEPVPGVMDRKAVGTEQPQGRQPPPPPAEPASTP